MRRGGLALLAAIAPSFGDGRHRRPSTRSAASFTRWQRALPTARDPRAEFG
jgi:hypothetical protein